MEEPVKKSNEGISHPLFCGRRFDALTADARPFDSGRLRPWAADHPKPKRKSFPSARKKEEEAAPLTHLKKRCFTLLSKKRKSRPISCGRAGPYTLQNALLLNCAPFGRKWLFCICLCNFQLCYSYVTLELGPLTFAKGVCYHTLSLKDGVCRRVGGWPILCTIRRKNPVHTAKIK